MEIKGIDAFFSSLYCLGSRNGQKDFEAVLAHDPVRMMLAEESYRLLMEPVFQYKEEGSETDVVVFRPLRDMGLADVYNWLLHFRCLDVDYDEFEDVAFVLDPTKHHYWRIHNSDMAGRRLFLTLDKDRLFQEGLEGGGFDLEYVTIPKSLKPKDVIRTGYTSSVVKKDDLVIAWRFPQDPLRSWHR